MKRYDNRNVEITLNWCLLDLETQGMARHGKSRCGIFLIGLANEHRNVANGDGIANLRVVSENFTSKGFVEKRQRNEVTTWFTR